MQDYPFLTYITEEEKEDLRQIWKDVRKCFQYLKYLFRHKYYVGVECFKRGLYLLAFIHDLSKFYPDEFFPNANHFDGHNIRKGRDKSGYYKPYDTGDAEFDYACFLHARRNKHHWLWWTMPKDDGTYNVFEMPIKYRTEMLCDWIGAGRAQGYISPKNDPLYRARLWYVSNKDNAHLGPETRKWVEEQLL